MPETKSSWVDAAKWRERWVVEEMLPTGGQGDAYRAKRKSDGMVGFLKAIRLKTDPERRARFFREASAYDTFRVDGVPALIESNAHHHRSDAHEPYIATTFVSGPTLRTWREESEPAFETAVTVVLRLIDVLEKIHAGGCVHRDVKPDNMILAGGEPARLTLLDFGLSFHEQVAADFRTEDWQEVGNRFLRLPELSAGSELKQDLRSDLSFAAGILFYLLTGEHPNILQDASGRLPHQRGEALARLQAAAGLRFARLASIFDTAFAPKIVDRHTNAAAFRAALERMMSTQEGSSSPDDDLAAILEVTNTSAHKRQVETHRRLSRALSEIQRAFSAIQQNLHNTFSLSQTAWSVQASVGKNTLYWTRLGSDEQLLTVVTEVVEVGDEIAIRLGGETVFRTDLADPDFGEDFQGAIRSWVLARMRRNVCDSNALPPEAEAFVEVLPFATLTEAAVTARDSNRRILAFVYDPSQPQRGNLRYCLGYFLQNRRTRDMMNSAFVTALVPLAQVAAISDVLNGLSMETSRWLVLERELKVAEQDVIYANPLEAERIMRALMERYPPGGL